MLNIAALRLCPLLLVACTLSTLGTRPVGFAEGLKENQRAAEYSASKVAARIEGKDVVRLHAAPDSPRGGFLLREKSARENVRRQEIVDEEIEQESHYKHKGYTRPPHKPGLGDQIGKTSFYFGANNSSADRTMPKLDYFVQGKGRLINENVVTGQPVMTEDTDEVKETNQDYILRAAQEDRKISLYKGELYSNPIDDMLDDVVPSRDTRALTPDETMTTPAYSSMMSSETPLSSEPAAFSSWAQTARLGGAGIWVGMNETEMERKIDTLFSQGVSVIEADSDLSNYLTDAQFDLELELMRKFADKAHKRGMRVVWYCTALEVVSPNGKNIPNTMYKEHPDWVQIGIDGVPNVFYGGSGQVFWVPPNDESAWMSPSSSGYRRYFFDRVRRIVIEGGIDGLWMDVPIYADFGPTAWADVSSEAAARFMTDTNYSVPTEVNWDDMGWRRWISWRHTEIARFLRDVTAVVHEENQEFPLFAETLPTDYNGGTVYGLDGGTIKNIRGLTHIWEVDTMSNTVGMGKAREDDWISFISALKYTRAASGKKPSWAFSYGKTEIDAEQVMAQVMIAGNNPYELMVPEMATTVGNGDFRTKMFAWVGKNSPYLFEAQSKASVAILFSSASRDFVDQFSGLGMFVTTDGDKDPLWWAESKQDSAYSRDYLAEHRGMVKLLVNEHIPFNIVVEPGAHELAGYSTVIMPDVQAISDEEAKILRRYVADGGNLLVTGPNPGGMNEFGRQQPDYKMADMLGFSRDDLLPGEHLNAYGAGSVHFYSERLGKRYFAEGEPSAGKELANNIRASSKIAITTDADHRVHMELSQLGDEMIIQFANFIGVGAADDFNITPLEHALSVNLAIPAGKQVATVELTSPDLPDTVWVPLDFSQTDQSVTFEPSVGQYCMVVVSFHGSQKPVLNHVPAPGHYFLHTTVGKPIKFDNNLLLSKSGDLDGDTLSITSVQASVDTAGFFHDHGNGTYLYSPSTTFRGTDVLTYSVSDDKEGASTGSISIVVTFPVLTYYPQHITVDKGSFDYGTMSSFLSVDGDTYDVKSKVEFGGYEVKWHANTTMQEDVNTIDSIEVKYSGHYSQNNVSQKVCIYNFQNNAWDSMDVSLVGREGDFPVVVTIHNNSEVVRYVSDSGELRVQVNGFRDGSRSFHCWSNSLSWSVYLRP